MAITVHNEYEYDSQNWIELTEEDGKFFVAGTIKGRLFGIDHATTIEQARIEYYAIQRVIRQIN